MYLICILDVVQCTCSLFFHRNSTLSFLLSLIRLLKSKVTIFDKYVNYKGLGGDLELVVSESKKMCLPRDMFLIQCDPPHELLRKIKIT